MLFFSFLSCNSLSCCLNSQVSPNPTSNPLYNMTLYTDQRTPTDQYTTESFFFLFGRAVVILHDL